MNTEEELEGRTYANPTTSNLLITTNDDGNNTLSITSVAGSEQRRQTYKY